MGAAGAAAMMGVWWSWELLSGMAGTLGEAATPYNTQLGRHT